MVEFLKVILVLLFVLGEANGTLTPNDTVSLDCDEQKSFTCIVTDGLALWNITGLMGINARRTSGGTTAGDNLRVINSLTNGASSSTITITGFSLSDNGGTIECVYDDGLTATVEGMAVISVGVPSCPSSVVAVAFDNNDAITVTWQQPPNTPPVTSTTVTYCPTSSPNCGNSMTCTSPCTISGLYPGTEYHFTVIPNNNCGSPTGCTGNTATAKTACICLECTSQPSPTVEALLLAGIIPTVVLLLANVVTAVVVFLITRHCYKKPFQRSSPSKGEDVNKQMNGLKTYEDIVMTDSPAYGPVK